MQARKILEVLGGIFKALRLALPKIGVGWMFALLSSNFNRITIYDLGVAAVIITVMIGMHNFLSPFQIVFGRIADRHPIFGLRRTPYLLVSGFLGSLVFVLLPSVAHGIGSGSIVSIIFGFGLMVIFGICTAIMGDSHHSLIAETTSVRERGGVISVVWTFTIMSTIVAATVFKQMMPSYSPEAMQRLYNLTPFVVVISALLGVLGIERRLNGEEIQQALKKASQAAPQGSALSSALRLFKQNQQVRSFFLFIVTAILGIFLQDAILEVYGAEVFGMSLKETTSFQQTWGAGVLLGMLLTGLLSSILPIKKKTIAMIGSIGTALGLGCLLLSAMLLQPGLITPTLLFMGFFIGLFNIGALSMMMEMTIDGATGLYMGMWGMAQALGNGLSSIVSGALKSALIETGLLSAPIGYSVIFGLETLLMVAGIVFLARVSVAEFKGLRPKDLQYAMEAGATA